MHIHVFLLMGHLETIIEVTGGTTVVAAGGGWDSNGADAYAIYLDDFTYGANSTVYCDTVI